MLSRKSLTAASLAILSASTSASVIDYFYATETDGALTTHIEGYDPVDTMNVLDYTLLFEWTADYYAITHIAVNASVLIKPPALVSDLKEMRSVRLVLYNATQNEILC